MDEINVNKRGLRLPSTPVEMTFNYPNGMIAYLIIVFSCISRNMTCSNVNCQVSAMELTEKKGKKIITCYLCSDLSNSSRTERLNADLKGEFMSVPEWQLKLPGDKIVTAREAFALISIGCRVFIGTGCGEPQHLIHAMVAKGILPPLTGPQPL